MATPNLLNPAGIDNERLRQGLLNIFTAPPAFTAGIAGDIAQPVQDIGIGLLNAQMGAIDPTGRVRAMSGQYGTLPSPEVPFSSPPIQRGMGGDPNAPESILASIAGLDPTDVGRGLLAMAPLAMKGKNAVRLTHFSKQKDLTKLDPEFYGTGIRGAERKRKEQFPELWVNRTYYGIDVDKPTGYRKEPGLGPVRYDVDVNGERIYDWNADPDGFFANIPEDVPQAARPSYVEQQIANSGKYGGYRVDNVVAMFDTLDVNPPTGSRIQDAAVALLGNEDELRKRGVSEKTLTKMRQHAERNQGLDSPLLTRPEPEDVATNIRVEDLPAPRMEERIKTTGAYRGGPKHIRSPQARQGLRKRVLSMVEEGAPGRLWYDRSSQSNLDVTGGLPGRRDRLAGFQSITSPSTEIKGNQGFGIKAYNQAAVGDPVRSGIFPNDMGVRLERVASGEEVVFPPKQGPFFQGVSQEPGSVVSRPTNDIRMGRAYEYDKDSDFDFSQGFTEAQHRWMDKENKWMVDYANKHKLGGFDDWNVERVQAAIWVSQKARQEGISIEEAMFDFATDLNSRTVSIASESTPAASLQHLTGVTDDPAGRQLLFDAQNRLLTDEHGRDVAALHAGALTRPSITGEGLYEDVLNPVTKTQILGGTATGSQLMDESTGKLARGIAGFHGLLKGQNATAVKFLRRAENAGLRNSARIELDGPIDADRMAKLQARLDEQFGPDNALADFDETGVDILVLNLDDAGSSAIRPQAERIAATQSASGSLVDPKRPAALTRLTNKTHQGLGLQPRTGLLDPRRMGPQRAVAPDRYAKDFQEEISGIVENSLGVKLTPDNFRDNTAVRTVTEGPAPGLLGDFDAYKPSEHLAAIDAAGPVVRENLDPLVRWAGKELNQIDEEIAQVIPNPGTRNEILVKTREALADGGFERLRELVKAGVLPAVVLGVFAAHGQSPSQGDGST